MSTFSARRFPARMSALSTLLAYARHCLADTPYAQHPAGRIELVLEELFTNTVTHGYGGECDRPIWVGFDVQPSQLAISYSDESPPYDPLQHDVDLDFDRAARPTGGLGILLARRFADRMEYRYASGRNVLTLLFDPPDRARR